MAKLYPPSIESKLPAQKGNSLAIPFLHNQAVGAGQYKGFMLLIKNAATNTLVDTIETGINTDFIVEFKNIPDLIVGQFYKVQLAYVDLNNVVGVYSTPGVFKFTAAPTLETDPIDKDTLMLNCKYILPSNDMSEYPYSYRFDVFQDKNCTELVYSTGELLNKPENQISPLEFEYTINLFYPYARGVNYWGVYTVTTVNNLSTQLKQVDSLPELILNNNLKCQVFNTPDFGAIHVIGSHTMAENTSCIVVKKSPFGEEQIFTTTMSTIDIYDYNIEHGVQYSYTLRVGNNTSEQAIIVADFEDIFLSDGERQLCVKFNPKVSTFKETIQESKINTIGGRFPITFRNGNSRYKEFALAGLLSYEMDNNYLFIEDKFYLIDKETRQSSNQTHTNDGVFLTPGLRVSLEKQFKLEVLNWLNNGKPKLFRSPTEGNYIIYLTNISLTPNDQLGRMLHSFSAQAYEIAEYNPVNLLKNKLLLKR